MRMIPYIIRAALAVLFMKAANAAMSAAIRVDPALYAAAREGRLPRR